MRQPNRFFIEQRKQNADLILKVDRLNRNVDLLQNRIDFLENYIIQLKINSVNEEIKKLINGGNRIR